MTKEEIKQVLDLSLEYYKQEVFGTEKESEKPSEERVDWIYERMKNDVPEDVEEALHGWLDEDNEPPYDLNVVC